MVTFMCFYYIQQVNLANTNQFKAATVITKNDFNTTRLRTVIDNNENTCIQFPSYDNWIKIWLGNNANVGRITVKFNKSGKFSIYF